MTSLTLLTAVVCIFALPALGSYSPWHHPRQQYRPYPRPSSYPFLRYQPFPYRPFPTRGPSVAQTEPVTTSQTTTTDGSGTNGKRQDRPNPPDAVAFSGNRKTTQYFFQQGPVIFNDVTTNIGGGYNSDFGVFTAFESGIYLVNYNVVSPREGVKTTSVDLFRNKEVINSASGSGSSGETSNSAVLFLNRYDQLSVQGRAESAVFCGDGGDDAFCSFNVALLKIGIFSGPKVARPVPGW